LLNGDTANAKNVFQQITEKDDYDWLMLATIAAQQADNRSAAESLLHVSDAEQWRKQKEYVKVRIAFNTGAFDEAFTLLCAQNDTSVIGRYNKILAAFGMGKYDFVIDSSKSLIAAAPNAMKPALNRLIGNAAIKNRDWETARAHFLQIIALQPMDTIAFYNCAVTSYNLGQIDEAWQYYQKARHLDPTLKNSDIEIKHAIRIDDNQGDNFIAEPVNMLDSLYNKAVELQQSGDTTAAIELYLSIVHHDRRYYRAWNNMGTIYGAEGNVDKAIEYYKKSVGDDSNVVDGYANLVNVYIALEKYRDAEKWLKRGKKKHPASELLLTMERQLLEAKQSNNR
jgi:tetratricopeptide (TPR) repeat protein